MSQPLNVETLRASDLEGVRATWSELAAAAGVDPLCTGPDWTLSHARAYSDPAQLFGILVREGATAVGWVVLRPEPSRGALALPRAIFAADGSYESDYLDLLVRPGYERPAVALILDELARQRGLQSVVLSGVPEDSPRLAALRAELDQRGWPRRELPEPCLIADLPDSFEAYLKGLRSRMRTKVRSARRKADAAGGTYGWCHDPDALHEHLEGLFRLHQARWAAAGGTGSFADERRRAFYLDRMPAALAAGELRLARLSIDGEAAAYQLGFEIGETYYQVQEGYEPKFADQRVGVALRGWVVNELIESGVRRYDFMAGDSSHKRDWGGAVRACTTVAFALPRLRARLAFRAKAAVEALRERQRARSEAAQAAGGNEVPAAKA